MDKKGKLQDDNGLDQLWQKLRSGDRHALGVLFSATFDSLYKYGYRIIPNSEKVRDAIQEVFFQLWKYRKNLSKPSSVRAYLFVSLRRELLNRKKAAKRREEKNKKYYDEEFDPLLNYSKWDEILNLQEKESKGLKKAIDKLTPRQREIIYLKYYEGLSTDEISKILDIRAQSIYNFMSESIKMLRLFLDR
ncbi:RNA polymerase sigma factor [Gracilimonas sp. Q87]|uniref:RNA polymerase sigma factor n=1 Tax=Gracilimonas sp. Q87 TaxID=3384766 RepID=UPI0039845FDE